MPLRRIIRSIGLACILALAAVTPVTAQKRGGTLNGYISANLPGLSIHEEADITTTMAMMAVFNNLVQYDPLVARNSLDAIIPDLAESWGWDESGTRLTFELRQGVRWHDGRPFTAKDVVCTWSRITGREEAGFRKNPRRIWYENLKQVSADGDHRATFHLERPQPSLPALLASGLSPVYPCHVAAGTMRTAPIGTGPFKLAEYKVNDSIRLVRNPDYWNKGLPYLDAITWRIVPNRSTRILGLIAGEFDITTAGDVTAPLMADINARAPHVRCSLQPSNVFYHVLINNARPPFDDPRLRRAVTMALDRQSFIDILSHGRATMAGAMLPPPEGAWGMPREELAQLMGYAGTLEQRQAEARRIMEELGYGPAKRLKVKVATREFQSYKDPAVILVDQLNKVFFEADLEILDTTVWFGRLQRQDFTVAMNLTAAGVDDPDVMLAAGFGCKSETNFTKYCNPEVDRLLATQSAERDIGKRRQLVWQIERILADDVARPIILHSRVAQCWHPALEGHLRQENSIYNNWRFERHWLQR